MFSAFLLASSVSADPSKTIIENALATPELSTLVKVLTAPGYEPILKLLSGPGPFTVFAPDNKAFARVPFNISHVEAVSAVLTYHVVSGKIASKDLASLQFPNTLMTSPHFTTLPAGKGQYVGVAKNGKDVTLAFDLTGHSRVVVADVECSNGIVHIVDTVLLPPRNTSTIARDGGLSILIQALVKTNLVSVVDGTPGLTIFAPLNSAFIAASWEKLSVAQLTDVLKYHVVAAEAFSTDLQSGQKIPTVEGKEVTVTIAGGSVSINDAKVVRANVISRNAVIHVIDHVLIPK